MVPLAILQIGTLMENLSMFVTELQSEQQLNLFYF